MHACTTYYQRWRRIALCAYCTERSRYKRIIVVVILVIVIILVAITVIIIVIVTIFAIIFVAVATMFNIRAWLVIRVQVKIYIFLVCLGILSFYC